MLQLLIYINQTMVILQYAFARNASLLPIALTLDAHVHIVAAR